MAGQIAERREDSINREVSRAMIHLTHAYTGRGPRRARTTINGNLVVCVLEDSLSKGELILVAKGHGEAVLGMRHRFQEAMRDDAIASVERLMGRGVTSFMSANHIEPDLAAEIFVLADPPPG
jgi:uncharacterized protein YbcI